jgi:predicted nuclease of predicted toxin-antitoxin system
MSIKILVDMNLSPDWVSHLQSHNWIAIHWSAIGDARASDKTIMDWALANGFVVLTHDLDFGTILALTHGVGPSVIQLRVSDVLPSGIAPSVVAAIRQAERDLASGALVVIDENRTRIRVLPI